MTTTKHPKSMNMPWEEEYGYSQAVQVGDTIYLSGQVSHDDEGKVVGEGDMEVQMRTAYGNVVKMLAQCGATMENIVDEILFVTDTDISSQPPFYWVRTESFVSDFGRRKRQLKYER